MLIPATPFAPLPATRRRARPPSRSWRWLSWLLGLSVLGAVVAAALHFAEAREFARIAELSEPRWLALAVALQAATYVAAGQVFRLVARAGGASLRLSTTCRLGFMKLFVDQALPSAGLSGTVVLANGLERAGVARPVVAAAIVIDLASYYVAFVTTLAVALGIAALRGEMNTLVLLGALVFVAFGVALSAATLALAGRQLSQRLRGCRALRPLRHALDFVEQADAGLARNPRLLGVASLCQLCIVLCDAVTVWVLIRSLGAHASPTGVFASFMISSLLRTIGVMPGGLGTFEAASVLTLRMVGVPTAVALAGTLVFRGLSFWLPLVPGLWFSRRALREPPV